MFYSINSMLYSVLLLFITVTIQIMTISCFMSICTHEKKCDGRIFAFRKISFRFRCYCQIEAPPPLPHSVSIIRSRTSSLSLPQSPEPSCTSLSDSASRRWTQRSTIVSRVSFDNVSNAFSLVLIKMDSGVC